MRSGDGTGSIAGNGSNQTTSRNLRAFRELRLRGSRAEPSWAETLVSMTAGEYRVVGDAGRVARRQAISQ